MILPVLLPDFDLDWAVYAGPTSLVRARGGLLEPAGERLGVDAIATADVVLAPGLAVDRTGMRIGRGGGCYDRALGRVPVGTFVCCLLYDDEVLEQVPADAHDRRVGAVATPSGSAGSGAALTACLGSGAGTRVSVSSAGGLDRPARERPGQRPPVDPQVGLVGVVGVEGVAAARR